MKKSLLIAAGMIGAGVFAATAANAAPLGGIGGATAPAADSGIVLVHGSHRACSVGPAGWHYHSRFRDRRIACRPPSPGRLFIWRSEGGRQGWWHRNERRWHN